MHPTISAMRAYIEQKAEECEAVGDMSPIHSMAKRLFLEASAPTNTTLPLSLSDAFTLGEVYQSSAPDSALFIIDNQP